MVIRGSCNTNILDTEYLCDYCIHYIEIPKSTLYNNNIKELHKNYYNINIPVVSTLGYTFRGNPQLHTQIRMIRMNVNHPIYGKKQDSSLFYMNSST